MKTIKCPICGSTEHRLIAEIRDFMYQKPEIFKLVRCSCGLVFINPQLSDEEILNYYPSDYCCYYSSDPSYRQSVQTVRNWIYEAILYWHYGWPHAGSGGLVGRIASKLLASELQYMVAYRSKARVLDVGCANGYWLKKLSKIAPDWELFGVEISPVAAKAARELGINVFNGDLVEAAFPSNFFDFITYWDVFEHLPRPIEELIEAHRVLKPGGELIMKVPNIQSFGSKLFGANWFPLDAPRHFFHYSPETLLKAFSVVGGFGSARIRRLRANSYLSASLGYLLEQNGLAGRRSYLFRAVRRPLDLLDKATYGGALEVRVLKNV